ncbi:MAG: DNA-binding response regulator [Candidatus Angelobacter sp.]|jgi:two-component system LytT family response regulator|nr:DNA-binding response regulator [Candidatus Angelobacter sp.]
MQICEPESPQSLESSNKGHIRCVVADPISSDRGRLISLLERQPDFQVVAECQNGAQALAAVEATSPDLLLFDIQLPTVRNIDVRKKPKTPPHQPLVIFFGASKRHAHEAFNRNAIDYLLKPVDIGKVEHSLQRAKQHLLMNRQNTVMDSDGDFGMPFSVAAHGASNTALHSGQVYRERFAVKSRDRILVIPVGVIEYVQAAGNYVEFHVGKEVYISRASIASTEALLNPSEFMRIHRSTIVNLSFVHEITSRDTGDFTVRLKGGQTLTLSRNYRSQLNRLF